jgi:hypothetical protein
MNYFGGISLYISFQPYFSRYKCTLFGGEGADGGNSHVAKVPLRPQIGDLALSRRGYIEMHFSIDTSEF